MSHLIKIYTVCPLVFEFSIRYTVQPVLSKHLRDNQNLLAYGRFLLNTGTFQCIYLFREVNTCLLNTDCLLNRGGH